MNFNRFLNTTAMKSSTKNFVESSNIDLTYHQQSWLFLSIRIQQENDAL